MPTRPQARAHSRQRSPVAPADPAAGRRPFWSAPVPIWLALAASLAYLLMIAVNALANILPLNGITTGGVSNAYPNLFAPASLTFSIWSLIYLLLAIHLTALFGGWGQPPLPVRAKLTRLTGYFIGTSLLNALWIWSWHFQLFGLSVVIMSALLMALLLIAAAWRTVKLVGRWGGLLRLPFSVYFGWITVALIANVTTWLVSLGWPGVGPVAAAWLILILIVGAGIGSWTGWFFRDWAYCLVLIWAYAGILLRHTAVSGFAGAYPAVIVTLLGCLLLFIWLLMKIWRHPARS